MSAEGPGLDPRITAVLNNVQRRLPEVTWLSTGQVAKILYLHPNTVRYWILSGRIRDVWVNHGVGRPVARYRISISEVERLLEEQRTEAAERTKALGSGA